MATIITASVSPFTTWVARSKSRRALAELNFGQLEDIGMSVAERNSEIRKGFWRA